MAIVDSSAISGSTAFRVAQASSIFLSAAAAGGNLGLSTFLIPRLIEAPTGLMLRQWQRMYDTGKIVFPSTSATAAIAFGYTYYVAQRSFGSSHFLVASKLPLLAAALCLSIVPYTLLAMLPTNKKLAERAAEAEEDAHVSKADRAAGGGVSYTAQDEQSAKLLIDRWGTLNLGRALLLAAGSITGLLAYL